MLPSYFQAQNTLYTVLEKEGYGLHQHKASGLHPLLSEIFCTQGTDRERGK